MDNINDEWSRISENPDNVIISESLRDILDASELAGTPAQDVAASVICKVVWSDSSEVEGTLLSHQTDPGFTTTVLSISAASGLEILSKNTPTSITIENNIGIQSTSIDLAERGAPNVSVEFEYGTSIKLGTQSAILVLAVPR